MDITQIEQEAINKANIILEQALTDGAGTILKMTGYDAPITSPYKEMIKSAFLSTVLSTLRSGMLDGTKSGNIPMAQSSIGNAQKLIGSILLSAGTISIMRLVLGCDDPLDTSYLDIKRHSDNLQIVQLGQAQGSPQLRTVANIAIPSDGLYDLYISCSNVIGTVQIFHLSWNY